MTEIVERACIEVLLKRNRGNAFPSYSGFRGLPEFRSGPHVLNVVYRIILSETRDLIRLVCNGLSLSDPQRDKIRQNNVTNIGVTNYFYFWL